MNNQVSHINEESYLDLPKIVVLNHQNWKIHGEMHLIDFLHEQQIIHTHYQQQLDDFIIWSQHKDTRCLITFDSIPLTIAIFHQNQKIYLYTQHINNELFYIQEMAKIEHPSYRHPDFQAYVIHVTQAAGMDILQFPSMIDSIIHYHKLIDLKTLEQDQALQQSIEKLTNQLLVKINEYRSAVFEKLSDFALNLTAQYALIRIHLLKFVAILPSLDHDKKGKEVKRMLLETLRRLTKDSKKARFLGIKGDLQALPIWLEKLFTSILWMSKLVPTYLLAWFIRFSVKQMAKRFIAGESIDHVAQTFHTLKNTNREATLDQLGELVVSEKEADHYQNEVLKLITGLQQHYTQGEKNSAQIYKSHVSIKVSALCSDFKPEAYEYTKALVAPRLQKILLSAKQHQVFLNIDAEHYDYRDLVFKIYRDVLLETPELSDYQQTGIVLQAYLRDALIHFKDILALAKERKLLMPIRLVKGAYWDAETVHADAHSYDAPEFLNKEETDISFRTLAYEMLQNHQDIQLCLASHNYSDHVFCEALRTHSFPQAPVIEHQCLHMTYEALSTALAKMGWAIRNYMPVGSLLVGMAYLVRRIMENSSQVGVLTMMRSHKNNTIVPSPLEIHDHKNQLGLLQRDRSQALITHQYLPVAPVRLYIDEHLNALQKALAVEQQKVHQVEHTFELHGDSKQVFSNSDLSMLIGEVQEANVNDVDRAVTRSKEYFRHSTWSSTYYIERSMILIRVAEEFLRRRLELASLIVREAGKNVNEALGDVDEAIDFLQFYAREEGKFLRINPRAHARGVLAVITPWNFPLAIPCGMTAAGLVAGNTVILKSAEQTTLIASRMVDIFHKHGIPHDALIHLPGEGESVGDALVQHPDIAGVVFTGSKKVGLYLAHTLGSRIVEHPIHQLSYPTKVITEMGGKNAVIVTANAELDETVAGILYSAFAHAGQKCSAASRVIVHESILLPLKERLKEAALDIKVSKAWDLETYINPIVSVAEQQRLKDQIQQASLEVKHLNGEVLVNRSQENLPGTCVGPAIFIVPPQAFYDENSFACRELFGPVLHMTTFQTLEQAIDLFNATDYALTGGVFAQSQDDIDFLTQKMECGNLYVNRSITGARVGIEPFGGFKLSGTGPKAGCPQYIEAFHVTPVVSPILDHLVRLGAEDKLDEADEILWTSPSQLAPEVQIPRVVKGMEQLIKNFEFLYQGIYGEAKDTLLYFKEFLAHDLTDFIQRPMDNVIIPGQVSVSDHHLAIDHLLVVAYEPRAYLSSLMSVITALARNVGVCVVCRNDVSFTWWSKVAQIFHQVGIDHTQMSVQQISPEALAQAIAIHSASTVLIDGQLDQFKSIAEIAYQFKFTEKSMLKLLTPFDSPDLSNYRAFAEQFSQVRSFAINTMRHGAPLDIAI